ncbi:MAG: hypothetical protein GC206_13290 [Alphaproteobacteria bacterium]|nr:hypothetical protein [Alphaproteobacteria bacterium]
MDMFERALLVKAYRDEIAEEKEFRSSPANRRFRARGGQRRKRFGPSFARTMLSGYPHTWDIGDDPNEPAPPARIPRAAERYYRRRVRRYDVPYTARRD